jgi:HK97 family phage portal protein
MNLKAAWNALIGKRALARTGAAYTISGGQLVLMDDSHTSYLKEGFAGNDIVFSIITQTAEKERMAPWAAYKIKDESSLKLYNAEMSLVGTPQFNIKRAYNYRTKALELYTADGRLNELLQWPNEEETFQDLVANSGAYKRMTGNRYLYGVLLEAGVNSGKPQEIHLLASDKVTPLATRTFPSRKVGYQMQYDGVINFSVEEVMHDKAMNLFCQLPGDNLVGMSPFKAARMILSRNRANKLSSTKSFQNQGPPYIIYVDDSRMSAEQAEEQVGALKRKLYEEHGGPENAKKLAISGYKTGATALGMSNTDLDSLKLEQWDVVLIAHVLNFPPLLLITENATMDNYKIAQKELVTKTAMPYLVSFRNHFNRKLSNHWGYKDKGLFIDFDATIYPELQPDKNEIAGWTSKVPLTIRQTYEAMQIELPEDYANDPMVDKIMMPNGKTLLDDLDPANMDREMDEVEEEDEL